jgi:hypothetical protein
MKNLLRLDDPGLELNIVFDNCSGQNKNNTVLKYLLWVSEMGYFRKVNFVFLIVGHTKNSADRLFNALKLDYQMQNIYTVKQLLQVLGRSKYCCIVDTKEEDFNNWSLYLDLFYRNFKDKKLAIIKQNHIFSCEYSQCRRGNQSLVNVRESDLPRHPVRAVPMIKNGFYGRYGFEDGRYNLVDFSYDKKMPLKKALAMRKSIIGAAMSDQLKMLDPPGINIFKQVEMFSKYRKLLPLEVWQDELYIKPAGNIMDAVKQEKLKRKNFRVELNEHKKKVAKLAKDEVKM